MRDYVDQLERQLLVAAREEAGRERRGRLSPRWGVIAGLAAVAGAAVAIAFSTGSAPERALAYPVLVRPATDASALDIGPELQRDGADLHAARRISTPDGTGYAIPMAGGGLCLAIPDPVDGYGKTCGSAAEIARRGLPSALVPSANAKDGAVAAFVAVLPADASAPVVHHADGSTETLAVQDGVAVTAVRDNVTITYEIDGTTQSIPVVAREPAMHTVATCDGPPGHYAVGVPVGAPVPKDPCGTP
jgi:hypothetical protein